MLRGTSHAKVSYRPRTVWQSRDSRASGGEGDVLVGSPEREKAPPCAEMQDLWGEDQGSGGMDRRLGSAQALLAETPRGDAPEGLPMREPDLGDLVVVLLVGTLAGLRDRLAADGFPSAAELVADLADAADDYIQGIPCRVS